MKICKLNKKAFTLAEVLITLGITGIIAALTIPGLIQNYKKRIATARLKAFCSIMSQAIASAENEQGLKARHWDAVKNNEDTYNYWIKYLAPHIKTLKVKKGYGTKVYFPNGSTLELISGKCIDLYFDINGDKAPNQWGRDKYFFFITTNSATEGYEISKGHSFDAAYFPLLNTPEKALKECSQSASRCSAYLQYTNFEFPDKYPYKL